MRLVAELEEVIKREQVVPLTPGSTASGEAKITEDELSDLPPAIAAAWRAEAAASSEKRNETLVPPKEVARREYKQFQTCKQTWLAAQVVSARSASSSSATMKATDSLDFWREYKDDLPHLAAMARRYLGSPCSSAASESAFSVLGEVWRSKRATLSHAKAEAIVAVKSYLDGHLSQDGGFVAL